MEIAVFGSSSLLHHSLLLFVHKKKIKELPTKCFMSFILKLKNTTLITDQQEEFIMKNGL